MMEKVNDSYQFSMWKWWADYHFWLIRKKKRYLAIELCSAQPIGSLFRLRRETFHIKTFWHYLIDRTQTTGWIGRLLPFHHRKTCSLNLSVRVNPVTPGHLGAMFGHRLRLASFHILPFSKIVAFKLYTVKFTVCLQSQKLFRWTTDKEMGSGQRWLKLFGQFGWIIISLHGKLDKFTVKLIN